MIGGEPAAACPGDGPPAAAGVGAPASGPAAASWRRVAAQAAWEVRAVLGNGEQLLVTLVLPVGVLVGMLRTQVPDLGDVPRSAGAVAGAIAVAVMSSAFTGQAIALGFDRRAGVLRLLATTPLGRGGLLLGRGAAMLVVLAVQVLALLLSAAWLAPAPSATLLGGLVLALPVLLPGAAAMLALAFCLAGTMRAEGVLGVANLLWVLTLVFGGLVVPLPVLLDGVGGTAGQVAGVVLGALPPALLGDGLRAAFAAHQLDVTRAVALLAWAAVAGLLAKRVTRWD